MTTPKNKAKEMSYRVVWERIKAANNDGFHIEAIALSESIIADRLLSFVLGVDSSSKLTTRSPFKSLIDAWRKLAASKCLCLEDKTFEDLGAAVAEWSAKRNNAIHGLVKSVPGTPTVDVDSFISDAKKAAAEGALLARKVSTWHKKQLSESPRAQLK